MPSTVLIVANDKSLIKTCSSYFSKKEYLILTAISGRQALTQARTNNLDAIVIDTTSPRLNCKTLCRKLRNESSAPLVLITQPGAKVDGPVTPAGIVPKPVIGKNLVARVKTAIHEKPPRLMTRGSLSLDLETHKLIRGSKAFPLTPKEFDLLKHLMSHAGQVVSRKALIKEVWQTDYLGDTRTLDVHIRWVRQKTEENPDKPERIVTLRGQGYRFDADKD